MATLAVREQDLAVLRTTFRRFPFVREVRIFGSRATGESRRASDLDLAVFAPEATIREWAELREVLEDAPLVFEIDLVRADALADSRLADKVAAEGLTIYP